MDKETYEKRVQNELFKMQRRALLDEMATVHDGELCLPSEYWEAENRLKKTFAITDQDIQMKIANRRRV